MKYRKDADYENLAKTDKVKKSSKGKSSKSAELSSTFYLTEKSWDENVKDGFFQARVVEVHKRYSFISPEKSDGTIDTRDVWIATVARKFLQAQRIERNFVCVGDKVLCQASVDKISDVSEDLPQCTIENACERHNSVYRVDPKISERRHVLACNVDQLLIVASYLNPTVKWGLIDRYIVLAESQRIRPVIILNKKDLLKNTSKEKFLQECRDYPKLYKELGYEVHSFYAESESAMGPEALTELEKIFSGKISMVSGHSGVGKSSLVNLLKPEIEQDVEKDGIFYKGRHTTTYASLIKLATGGYVVDTPGIRSFAIEERTAVELSWCFVEMRDLIGKCKYRECRHIDEPECAVRQAVRDEKISEWRYKSYLAILTGATGREGRLRDINL